MKNFLKIPVKTFYMKMCEKPKNKILLSDKYRLVEWKKEDINLYKKIYKKIGSKWG